MNDAEALLKDKLQKAKDAFGEQLPERLDEADQAWEKLLASADGVGYEASLEALINIVHKLAGTAPTLGFVSVGRIAKTIQTLLLAVQKGHQELSNEERQQIASLLNDLRVRSTEEVDVFQDILHYSGSSSRQTPAPERNDVLVLQPDSSEGELLAAQLTHYGYHLNLFREVDGLTKALEEKPASAVLICADSHHGVNSMSELVTHIKGARKDSPPIILVGVQDTLDLRLQAVRSGAEAFLTNAMDTARIVSTLDELTDPGDSEPYRVLIVEDSQALSELYRVLLEGVGMTVRTVLDPMEIMGPLHELNPDIILMDINMPGCNGIELAQVIRQREEFFQTPIIFLTADGGFERELLALKTGGDDFFAKPVYPELLISSIKARAERARLLSSMISRDSMTGLANHTKIKELLDDEFARAKRAKQPLSFAMLDIDNFKNVNDTYGHWTGDTVIKSLAQVLRQRLRRSDIIGRYGGEEFAIVLSSTDGDTAVRVLDEIRAGFAEVVQRSDDVEFATTFSCGIASFPGIESPAELNKKADEALYEAKNGGKNKVCMAS